MNKQVGYENLHSLQPGDLVRVLSGRGGLFFDADAVVTQKPGITKCLVRITKIYTKGRMIKYCEGEEILADTLELFFTTLPNVPEG